MATRTRRRNWKLDEQGQFARQIGWKTSRTGKRTQHKFRLGDDIKEAVRREDRLQQLWECLERRGAGTATWDELSLELAQQIAKGEVQLRLAPLPAESPVDYAKRLVESKATISGISKLGLSVVPTDSALFEKGSIGARTPLFVIDAGDWAPPPAPPGIESVVLRLPRGNLLSPKMLHEAMDAYVAHLREEYFSEHLRRITDHGQVKIKQLGILKERHPDVSLSTLDQEEIEKMIRLWRHRPKKKGSSRPITRKSAQHLIGELNRFLAWLHRSKAYDWRKPSDFGEIDRTVDTLPTDHVKRFAQVETFSLEELMLLNKYATPLERVLLLLGLNCAFGRAEIATLAFGEVCLFQGHSLRQQEQLRFQTTNEDSFIRRVRRKNRVYGEFILFPQTVQALEWALSRAAPADQAEESPILLSENGEPLNKPTGRGNANNRIPNRFGNLIRRILADDNEINNLSFGKLRKTAGDLVRRFSNGETAGVFLCHGQPVASDDLLDLYSNRQFGRVFEAIRKVEAYLAPFFLAAGPTPFVAGPRATTSRKKIDKIKELDAQGFSVRKIAEEVGRSKTTVHRQLKRPAVKPK